MEKYTGKGWTDVLEYFEQWMKEVIEPKKRPGTIKGYWSYYRNWIKPDKYMTGAVCVSQLPDIANFFTLPNNHNPRYFYDRCAFLGCWGLECGQVFDVSQVKTFIWAVSFYKVNKPLEFFDLIVQFHSPGFPIIITCADSALRIIHLRTYFISIVALKQ